jgi:hypothetical protein
MSKLFGGGSKPTAAPVQDIQEDEVKKKKVRSALFATEQGALGEEVGIGQVEQRQTFFGN